MDKQDNNDYFRTNTFNSVLNFSFDEQMAIDDIIIYTTSLYIKAYNNRVSLVKNIDFSNPDNKSSYLFFQYGLNLIKGGIMPNLLNMVMDYNLQKILFNSSISLPVVLQLLFVKESVMLLHKNKFSDYVFLISQLSSPHVPIKDYELFFNNLLSNKIK